MIGFYEVLVLPLLLELERARDENHFISHATIAIVPNPVIVSMLYALNNAIDAATSVRVRDLSTPPTVHNGK